MTLIRLLLLVSLAACGSTPKPVPDEKKEKGALLDEPTGVDAKKARKGSKKNASLTEVMLLLPDRPEKMSYQIDGDTSDWKGKRFKTFKGKKYIESGEEYWSGKNDTAMRIAIDSDGGWLYFAIEVKDDAIIDTPKGKDPIDSVVITLRDPGLDLLEDSLPRGVGLEQYVDATTEITVLTDGRVFSVNDDVEGLVEAATDEKKNGYTIEVAIKLEAFEEVTTLPLDELAFRIDIRDGDEEDRAGLQTVYSTVPSSFGTKKRLAKTNIIGLIPHHRISGGVPRTNAIGRWQFEEDQWKFQSFEVVPRLWVTIEDPTSFQNALRDDDVLGRVCNAGRKDIHLVEAYQSKGGKFRAGLVLCGQRAVKNKCSKKAKTQVIWVKLEPTEDSWEVTESINVFDKTLNQCTYDPVKDKPYFSHFSLFPMDMMGSAFWLVGWTEREAFPQYEREKLGVTVLNTKADEPRVAQLTTDQVESNGDEQQINRTSTFLTLVNDDDAIDICQIEKIDEQYCSSFKRGCKTHARGRGVAVNIFTWNKGVSKFEPFLLSKHKNCGTSFEFDKRKAYLILQLKQRVGLLPSPVLADDEDDIDLF